MQAVPHQCLEIYAEVSKKMTIVSIMKGATVVADNLNKGLYLIFGRFAQYFNAILAQVNDPNAANHRPHHADINLTKLTAISKETMDAFEAPERRMYMQMAIDRRSNLKDQITVEKSFVGGAISIMKAAWAKPDFIGQIRDISVIMRLELLTTCAESLNGFQGLIFAIQWYRLGKMPPPFDIRRITNLQESARDRQYTEDERDTFSGMIDEMNENVAMRYFYLEIEKRMSRIDEHSLSRFTINKLNELKNIEKPSKAERQKFIDDCTPRFDKPAITKLALDLSITKEEAASPSDGGNEMKIL